MKITDRIDSLQQRRRGTAIAAATYKKFSDDHSSNLAAMIAFWAFFSIFPLLLVGITILGWALPASEKSEVLRRIAEMFPLLETSTIKGLTGSVWALVLGSLSTLWSGLGIISTVEEAFNSVWEVPRGQRPNRFRRLPRTLAILATIGFGLVLTTLLSSFITGSANGVHLGLAGHVGGYVVAVLADVALVLAAFRILTVAPVSLREVLPGALLTGVVFFVLQELSAFIISRHLRSAQSTYGHFATVITILWWFYLQAELTMFGAQLNVVLKERLYPRSLFGVPRTEPDRRALQAYAEERTYTARERVRTELEPPGGQ